MHASTPPSINANKLVSLTSYTVSMLQMLLNPNRQSMGRSPTMGPVAASAPGSSCWPCWGSGRLSLWSTSTWWTTRESLVSTHLKHHHYTMSCSPSNPACWKCVAATSLAFFIFVYHLSTTTCTCHLSLKADPEPSSER